MGRFVLALAGLGLAGCVTSNGTASPPRPPQGCLERRVVVGSFGDSEWSRHFTVALAAELRDEGFTVVGESVRAELALTGEVTMTPVEEFRFFGLMRGASGGYRKGMQPVVSIEARRPTGEPVWSHYYASTKEKTLADWAEEAAEDLWRACKRQWRP